MSSDSVSQIKDRLSIEDVVGEYVKLDRAGASLKGCCPFHNEKTPSFFVSPDRGTYYCFGCGAKGDIFSFVQEYEGVEFKDALKTLADKAGVELQKYSKEDSKRDEYFRIMEGATKFYEAILKKNKSAHEYLKGRGLKDETITEWRLGVAPDEWRSILEFLKSKKVIEKDIETVGLIKKGEKGSHYDRFRNRIMFPLFNQNGKVVGFSGRTLSSDDKEAKYLNSPETPLFNKSELLYGFNFAKKSIRKLDFSIIVEGQVDVIMAHQAGYSNTVATSGTSLTEQHVEYLGRLSKRLVIALDGDGAGLRASERAWKIALSNSMDVKVVLMPEGLDPASVIQNDVAQWKSLVKDAKHIIDFLIAVVKKENLEGRTLLRKIKEVILPYVASLESSMEQSHFVERISNVFDVPSESVWEDVRTVDVEEDPAVQPATEEVQPQKKNTILEQMYGIIFWQESVDGTSNSEVLTLVKKSITETLTEEKYGSFYKYYAQNKDALIFQIEELYQDIPEEKIVGAVQDVCRSFKKGLLEKKRTFLQSKLKEAEIENDSDKQSDILSKIQTITKQLAEL